MLTPAELEAIKAKYKPGSVLYYENRPSDLLGEITRDVFALLAHVEEQAREITTLSADRERLRAALKEYGQHAEECPVNKVWKEKPCDCGLTAALTTEKGKP